MPTPHPRRLRATTFAATALLMLGLTTITGCGPDEGEKEAALERGREVMAEIQADILNEKSGAVAEALREQAMGEMSRGAGDQFTMREPTMVSSRAAFVQSVVARGISEEEAMAGWEQQKEAVYADWSSRFGEVSGLSADRLTMLWQDGAMPPVEGGAMPDAAWPADESGEAMSKRITVGLLMRYGCSEAFSTGQWEQHRDENRQQFIDIVVGQASSSPERAAELWDTPRG